MPPAGADVFELYPLNADADCDEPLEKVANALQPGDELVLHAGVYSQSCIRSISVQGAPGRPVVIRAADGASVLVTRPADNIASQNNLEVVDSSHLVIRGLRFGGGSGPQGSDSHKNRGDRQKTRHWIGAPSLWRAQNQPCQSSF